MKRPQLPSGLIVITLLVGAAFLPHVDAQEPVVVAVASAPYRHARYQTRCARESRLDASPATTVEDRAEARARALQQARGGGLDEVLLFARLAYGETGTPVPGRNDDPSTPLVDEYEGFLAVIDHRRGQMSRAEMMVYYGPRRVFPRESDVRQRWIAELTLDGRRPPSWPAPRGERFHSHPAWRHYGCPRWLATVDASRTLFRHYEGRRVGRGPFPEVPHHWGGDMDAWRARQGGWRTIRYPFANNNFWVVPEATDSATDPEVL